MTNILAHDQHYHRVARLWIDWAKRHEKARKTPRQVFEEHQQFCNAFDTFCVLLVCRAFQQLGFTSDNDQMPCRGAAPLSLRRRSQAVSFVWNDDGIDAQTLLIEYPQRFESPVQHTERPWVPGTWLQWGDTSRPDAHNELLLVSLPTGAERNQWLAEIESHKKRLRAKGRHGQTAIGELSQLQATVTTAGQRLTASVLKCPLCSHGSAEAPTRFEARENGQMTCTCSGCRATWGIRRCSQCTARFAYLLPSATTTPRNCPIWVDRELGADVLAVPCLAAPLGEAFICPRCGHCSNSQSAQRLECRRCLSSSHR